MLYKFLKQLHKYLISTFFIYLDTFLQVKYAIFRKDDNSYRNSTLEYDKFENVASKKRTAQTVNSTLTWNIAIKRQMHKSWQQLWFTLEWIISQVRKTINLYKLIH